MIWEANHRRWEWYQALCQWAWLMFVWQWKGLNAIHRRGHSTKLVVRYFVYYYTIWWTITDTGACVPRTKISSWPFTYVFTCYSNPLNVKCIICLFHLSCFKIHFHLLNVCCGKKCLNTCGSTCSAMIGREKRPEYVLRHQMLHSGRK